MDRSIRVFIRLAYLSIVSLNNINYSAMIYLYVENLEISQRFIECLKIALEI